MPGFEEIHSQFDAIQDEVRAANERFAILRAENDAYKAENDAYKTALADCRRELEAMRKTLADTAQESEKRAAQAEKAAKALSILTASLERAQEKHGQWLDGYRRLEALRAAAPDGEIKGIVENVQLVLSGEEDAVGIGEAELRTRLRTPGVVLDGELNEALGGGCVLHDDDFTRRGIDVGGKGAQKIEGFAHRQ